MLPTVSISVETTSTDVNGDGFTGIASVNGTVMDVPATIEDKDDSLDWFIRFLWIMSLQQM